MKKPEEIKLKDYNYVLPEEKIAKYPLKLRDHSRLLLFKNNEISTDRFFNLHNHLKKRDTLVFNNTKVVHARLIFKRPTGARIEIFCLEPYQPADHQVSFSSRQKVIWKCLVGNARKWKNEELLKKNIFVDKKILLTASKVNKTGNSFLIEFSWNDSKLSFSEIIELFGSTPIPPYLKREAEDIDSLRYQTIYSKNEGSVAAPTAGLHFTDDVLFNLNKKGISKKEITLHVGAGTFVPVKTENALEHKMHTEKFFVQKELLQKITCANSRIIAVGTTSCRTLESLYWLGIKQISGMENDFHLDQWDAWKLPNDIPLKDSIDALLTHMEETKKEELSASTGIMIIPGYEFKVISGLITNFHQPSSTLLMLIAAFTGNYWKRIYQYALDNEYRFLSYGDTSLLLR